MTADKALEMAANSDRRIADGSAGPLEGLPIGVKDLFCTQGVETTACSAILKGFVPAYESTVTSQLWRDGAVMLGKLNCDEFAMGSANETSVFGPAVNPWSAEGEADLAAGGSSGGSASSVAAGSALMATGTDTGGSIRQPAAFCGVVGMKPTYGRCSRWGIVAFASSLDQAGPFTRDVADSALMFASMAGHDARDSTSADAALPDLQAALQASVKGLKIGIPKEYVMDGMDEAITALWQQGQEWLVEAGQSWCRFLCRTHAMRCQPIILLRRRSLFQPARYDGVRYGARVEAGQSLDDMYEATRAPVLAMRCSAGL